MKPTVLAVFDNNEDWYVDTYIEVLKRKYDITVVPAVLKPEHADRNYPYVADELKRLKAEGVKLDGVLLHDASIPADNLGLQQLHSHHRAVCQQLEKVDADYARKRQRIGVTVSDADPVVASAMQERMNGHIDDAFQRIARKHRDALLERKNDTEYLLMTNPPSDRGIELIRALRSDPAYSEFKDVPIIVGMAHPKKKETFLGAGASAVHTSSESFEECDGIPSLMDAIGCRPGPSARKAEPKTHRDQARRSHDSGSEPSL
jgi:CheY-like chemotaxis protein